MSSILVPKVIQREAMQKKQEGATVFLILGRSTDGFAWRTTTLLQLWRLLNDLQNCLASWHHSELVASYPFPVINMPEKHECPIYVYMYTYMYIIDIPGVDSSSLRGSFQAPAKGSQVSKPFFKDWPRISPLRARWVVNVRVQF